MNLLAKILDANGVSHNKFAKDLGISKSYIIPMINGEKNITLNIYNKMLELPYLDPYKAEISNLYFRQKIGNEKFNLVNTFLSEADKFTSNQDKTDFSSPEPVNPADFIGKKICKDETVAVVAQLLRNSLNTGAALLTNYPFSCEELDDALFAVAKEKNLYSDSAISHIVYHNNKLDAEAIKTYWNATKWAPMKVITKVAHSKCNLHPLPFYTVTSDTVVMFNAECEGFVFNSTELAKHFRKQHKEINATPIVSVIHEETELLTGCAVFCGNRMRAFENIICPVGMYDYDMLMSATNKAVPFEVRDVLVKAYLNYYMINDRYTEFISYCKIEAVKDWLKNGREYSVTPKYLNTFPLEDRKKAVERISEAPYFRLIKEGRINIPLGYGFDSFDAYLETHTVLTNADSLDYEIFSHFDYTKIRGLEGFVNNMFEFLSLEYNTFPQEKAKALLKQFAILGDMV